MSSPVLPDHTVDGGGPGQPIHTEENGQFYALDPYPQVVYPQAIPGLTHPVTVNYVDANNVPQTKVINVGPAVDSSSLHPGKYITVLLLDRIFRLLAKIIESLQRAASVQAQRLNFLTQWQKAYTDSMNQVHSFIQGDTSTFRAISDEPGDDHHERADLNQANSTYTEQMRSNRSIIQDDAKALQSVLNQTNDAVNQQSNMATSIIQQFSTILGSIYR